MPWKPQHPCSHPGCGKLVDTGYCDDHKAQVRASADQQKDPQVRKWQNSARWKKLRGAQLRAHPLCQCERCREGDGYVVEAGIVDHVVPHKGSEVLFFDPTNLQSMAKACHDRKTASRDGGFGHRRR